MRFAIQVLAIFLLFYPIAGHAGSMHSIGTDAGREIVTTRHTITVKGIPLTYTARAGFIPLLDEATGEVHARIFFVSYTVDPKRGSPARPLTFYTNGGPGAPGTLDDLGPRSLKGVKIQGHLPPPPYQLVDNQKTWLTFTDLVLIDPVGTGYSRAAKPEYAVQYYNPDGDAESITQFIQRYLGRYVPAMRQPVFVAGISYGAVRSALIAGLAKRRGLPLRGLILLSSPLGNQPRRDLALSELGYIQQLPTFTATAFFHKKLSPHLQRNLNVTLGQAESWATKRYPKILAQTGRLTPAQQQTDAAEMARLTGLSSKVILKHRFRILPDAFLRELLGTQWTPDELYDSRLLKIDQAASEWDRNWYSVLSSLYLGGELHFRSGMPYAGSVDTFVSVYLNGWHCGGTGGHDCGATPQAWAVLQRTMQDDPSLRVMITNGYYDFACPYFGSKMAISQLEPDLRERVSATYYHAGHRPPLVEVQAAVAQFIHDTLARLRKND